MLYIDTSVLVAYYCPELLSSQAEKQLRSTLEPAISELTEVELSSAMARKVREGEMNRRDAVNILTQFQAHQDNQQYVRLILSRTHYRIAKDWLNQMHFPLCTLDALHLAIASAENATIITADAQLAKCAKSMGLSFKLLSKGISA
ncbi:MAG: type II toxin-antitoxin system VapC family toxin [Nitrospiraceae bacterium]